MNEERLKTFQPDTTRKFLAPSAENGVGVARPYSVEARAFGERITCGFSTLTSRAAWNCGAAKEDLKGSAPHILPRSTCI
jgi:hypothetical protein